MSSKRLLTYATGTLAILGATCIQAATVLYCSSGCLKTDADFMADLENFGFEVSTTQEGFDLSPWGTDTDIVAGGTPQPSVSNLGITWTSLTTNNGGDFATSTGGGDVHDGTHLMYAVDSGGTRHPIPDGYSLAANNANTSLYAVGGWFTGNNAVELSFIVDGDTTRVDFPGEQTTLSDWTFLGFIENDPAQGFNSIEILSTDETGDETKIFFSDDFTFAGEPGALTAPVPLPAALPLFGSALLGIIGIVRRRNRV